VNLAFSLILAATAAIVISVVLGRRWIQLSLKYSNSN
jgi:hypothetical protein